MDVLAAGCVRGPFVAAGLEAAVTLVAGAAPAVLSPAPAVRHRTVYGLHVRAAAVVSLCGDGWGFSGEFWYSVSHVVKKQI